MIFSIIALAPKNLNSLFKTSNHVHCYKTKSISNKCFYNNNNSIITESSRHYFVFTGTKLWNCLPVSLKTLNKSKFKRNIRTLLLQALENANDYINLEQIMNYMKVQFHIDFSLSFAHYSYTVSVKENLCNHYTAVQSQLLSL